MGKFYLMLNLAVGWLDFMHFTNARVISLITFHRARLKTDIRYSIKAFADQLLLKGPRDIIENKLCNLGFKGSKEW